MAIEDLIAHGIAPVQYSDPLDARTKVLNLRDMVQRHQLGQQQLASNEMKNQQESRALADDAAYRQTVMDRANGGNAAPAWNVPGQLPAQAAGAQQLPGMPGVKPGAIAPGGGDTEGLARALEAKGLHTQAMAVRAAGAGLDEKRGIAAKDQAEAHHFDMQTAQGHALAVGQAYGSLANLPEDQQTTLLPSVNAGLIAQGHLQPSDVRVPDGVPIGTWLKQQRDAVMAAHEQASNHLADLEEQRKAALAPSQLASSEADASTKKITADQYKDLGMTKDQFGQLTATQQRDAVNAKLGSQRVAIAGAELGLKQKTFNATIGAGMDANGQPVMGPDGKPAVNPTAAAIANYQIPPPAARSLATPMGQNLMRQVLAVNPQFQGQNFQAYQKTENDATSGKIATSAGALNTMMGHLSVLNNAADALKNGDYQKLNQLGNYLGVQTGKSPATTFQTIVHRLGPEVTKAYLASGGSVGERGTNEEDFSSNLSPDQLKQNIGVSALLADSKIKALQDQYQRGTYGRGQQKLISDEADKARQSLTQQAPANLRGGGTAATTFAQTATGPNNHKIGSNDGKTWFDVQTGKKVQ